MRSPTRTPAFAGGEIARSPAMTSPESQSPFRFIVSPFSIADVGCAVFMTGEDYATCVPKKKVYGGRGECIDRQTVGVLIRKG